MKPQDVISAIERYKINIRPCVSGKTWSAHCWVNGVLKETRKHPNITSAVRTLVRQLAGADTKDCASCDGSGQAPAPTPLPPPDEDEDADEDND